MFDDLDREEIRGRIVYLVRRWWRSRSFNHPN